MKFPPQKLYPQGLVGAPHVFAAGGAGAGVATTAAGVAGAGVGAGVGVGVSTGVAVADGSEPPPTARGEDAVPDVPEEVSVHAAADSAKTMQSAHTAAVTRNFMPPGPSAARVPYSLAVVKRPPGDDSLGA